ncbi:MAG: tetratricopeptide repeat protein [Bacteroidota bacterium]
MARTLTLILGLLSVGFAGLLPAKPLSADPTSVQQQIEKLIASFRLDAAEAKLPELSHSGYQAYYQGNIQVYRHMGRQDVASFRAFQREFSGWLKSVQSLPENNSEKLVMMGELHCKRALLEFLHHNYLTAAHHARTGRQLINENAKRFPNNHTQLKMLGLFNVVLGAVPRRYQWLINILGYSGDLNTGIDQLKLSAEKGKLLAMEAEIILYHVDKNILNRSDLAIGRLRQVRAAHGPNLILDYFLATGLMSIKQNEPALKVLYRRELYAGKDVYFIPFWDYQLGKAYYYRGDMTRARRYLARFVRDYKGSMFRTDAHFRLGMALTLNGHYELGKPFFQAVAEGDGAQFDEDAYARHMSAMFAKQAPSPSLTKLFQARNYFDGGYFDKALATLDQMAYDDLSKNDQAEWHYRYGRILHSQGELGSAIGHYQECLALPVSQTNLYLHAYASFFQADIARAKNDLVRAKKFYQQALGYDGYFYQDGLENRCRAALARLKRS